nr:uncharacterized protein LOC106020099 [Anas platyrhynchos]XP_012964128.2 uncharacterized protein LOC106020099 [Anas platyrhynchos]|eukprot:XP_012964127.2 uncharacterized protein LOC106020099 [Anas platyrhynchos]
MLYILVLFLQGQLSHGQERRNNFFILGEEVAKAFNLSNCWVCGGPGGDESWPWVAGPVEPKWWVSNLSEVHNGTQFWKEEGGLWQLHSSDRGMYCLNRTGTVAVGKSICNWTLSPGYDCADPECRPINCTARSGQWNATHVQLRNGTWLKCSYREFFGSGCETAERAQAEGQFDSQILSCQHDNTTREQHVVRVYRWRWQDENGRRVFFKHFWSAHNMTGHQGKLDCNCKWESDAGAWRCTYTSKKGADIVTGPLGDKNTLYFHAPKNKEGWDGPFPNGTWALKGHYWVCGKYAYKRLPKNWSGICYVGYIRPLFFLLSQIQGNHLQVTLYDDVNREKRSTDASLAGGSAQKWGENEWPPERIIQHYGPATWNPNEVVSGAQEPIYNLNRIIRLQTALEIITSQTTMDLGLLTDRFTQLRNAIFQHRMVLDYLLAEDGGACGKLNDSNCCLQIDDNGKVVKQITKEIRKLAHVPVQTWKGMDWDLFSWLPGRPWVKQMLFLFLCGVMMLLFIPCMIPCFTLLIRRIINSNRFVMTSVGKKGDMSIMMLKQRNPQEPTDEMQLLLAKVEE